MSDLLGLIPVNQYLQKTIKNFSSYQELAHEVISKGKLKQRNGKHILTVLRELCFHNFPNQPYEMALAETLLVMVKDNSTHDIDRKIVRSCYFLLTEIVLNAPQDSRLDGIALEVVNSLLSEIKSATDSRLCMAWRLLSRVSHKFQHVNLFDDTLRTIFKDLKYPEKEKRLLLGKKKASQDFENQLHFWTALFSSFRRVHMVPPVDCVRIIFLGCKSSHTQLSRHAFYVLKFAIEKYPLEVCPMFHEALKDSKILSQASSDVHSCIYLMEVCKSFIISLVKQQSYSYDPIVDTLNYLFMLLSDTNVKIRIECIRILTDIPPVDMFGKALLSMGVDNSEFIARMISAIQPSLQDLFVPESDDEGMAARRESAANLTSKRRVAQPIGFGNVNIGPLCRACIRLGRYVIVYLDSLLAIIGEGGKNELKLNEVFKPLAKELVRLMNEFRKSKVFLSHAYCDTLKALLWLLPPDTSEENKSAVGMYVWFQNQAISALHTLQESLTETVMRHIFGRIEESPGNPDILLNMALKCAEEAVACFDNSSGQAVGMLIQVWEQFAARKNVKSIQGNFLCSLLSAVDGSLWQSSKDTRLRPEQGLLSLKYHAFWALGENVHIWDGLNESTPRYPPDENIALEGVLYSFPEETDGASNSIPPLILVTARLVNALQCDEPSFRNVCLESLFKIAAHVPPDNPIREIIEQELHGISANALAISSQLQPLQTFFSVPPEDPRSHPILLASMGLSEILNDRSCNSDVCHPGARWLSSSTNNQLSVYSQDALLFSVALESLKNFDHDTFPKFSFGSKNLVKEDFSATQSSTQNEGEVDLLGDIFSASNQTSADDTNTLVDLLSPVNVGSNDITAAANLMTIKKEASLESLLVNLNMAKFFH